MTYSARGVCIGIREAKWISKKKEKEKEMYRHHLVSPVELHDFLPP
jgi:hypothetical protein